MQLLSPVHLMEMSTTEVHYFWIRVQMFGNDAPRLPLTRAGFAGEAPALNPIERSSHLAEGVNGPVRGPGAPVCFTANFHICQPPILAVF